MAKKDYKNYKIGDLVVNEFPLELDYENFKIKQGEIGLIVGTVSSSDHAISNYDYVVLIRGKEVFFFEKELKLYKSMGVAK